MVDEEEKVRDLLISAQSNFYEYSRLKKQIETMGWTLNWTSPFSGATSKLEAIKTITRKVLTT